MYCDVIESLCQRAAVRTGESRRGSRRIAAREPHRFVMARGERREIGLVGTRRFKRGERSSNAVREALRRRDLGIVERCARIAAMDRGGLAAPQLGELGTNVGKRLRKPRRAGPRTWSAQHRPLQRGNRGSIVVGAEPRQRFLRSASSGTGARRDSATSATARAKAPAAVSASGSPPESSAVMFQRLSSTATRRARARSGVTSSAVRVSSVNASRNATAMTSASSSALAASITVNPAIACSMAWRESFVGEPPAPGGGRGRRPQCFARENFAAVRRGRNERRNIVPRDPDAREKRVHRELRMAGGARRRRRARPSSSRSVSRPGSTTAPRGSVAIVASSFAVAGIEPVEPAAITGGLVAASRAPPRRSDDRGVLPVRSRPARRGFAAIVRERL